MGNDKPGAERDGAALDPQPRQRTAMRKKSRFVQGIRLYWILVSASVRAKMQYKFDFISTLVIQGLMGMYDYFIIAVVLWKFRSVQGWDIWEIGLLYSVSRIGWGMYRTLGGELDRFEGYILHGDFDSVLLRPWPSLFVVISRNLELTRAAWILQGIGVGSVSVTYLLASGKLGWTDIAYLFWASIWTSGLYAAVGIATASAAFKIVRIEELQVITEHAPDTAVLYPLDIYPTWLRYILLTVIPLAVGNYIPVRYILGKGGTWLNLALPPFAAAAALYVASRLWRAGERLYHSTGS